MFGIHRLFSQTTNHCSKGTIYLHSQYRMRQSPKFFKCSTTQKRTTRSSTTPSLQRNINWMHHSDNNLGSSSHATEQAVPKVYHINLDQSQAPSSFLGTSKITRGTSKGPQKQPNA